MPGRMWYPNFPLLHLPSTALRPQAMQNQLGRRPREVLLSHFPMQGALQMREKSSVP